MTNKVRNLFHQSERAWISYSLIAKHHYEINDLLALIHEKRQAVLNLHHISTCCKWLLIGIIRMSMWKLRKRRQHQWTKSISSNSYHFEDKTCRIKFLKIAYNTTCYHSLTILLRVQLIHISPTIWNLQRIQSDIKLLPRSLTFLCRIAKNLHLLTRTKYM